MEPVARHRERPAEPVAPVVLAVPRREHPATPVVPAALRHQQSVGPVSHNYMNDMNDTTYTTPPGMSREEFRAMGTTISLLLPDLQAAQGLQIVQTSLCRMGADLEPLFTGE